MYKESAIQRPVIRTVKHVRKQNCRQQASSHFHNDTLTKSQLQAKEGKILLLLFSQAYSLIQSVTFLLLKMWCSATEISTVYVNCCFHTVFIQSHIYLYKQNYLHFQSNYMCDSVVMIVISHQYYVFLKCFMQLSMSNKAK